MAGEEDCTGLTSSDRLLIVKTSSIGDVVHALPFAQIVKEHVPDVFVGWAVRRRCASLVAGNPWLDVVHTMDDQPSMRDLAVLRRELRAQRYSVAMDMQGLLLSGIVTRLSGARRRIGLDLNREGNTRFLTEPVVPARRDRNRHAVDILRGFLTPIGIERDVRWPALDYLAEPLPESAGMVALGSPRAAVALNVGASTIYKQWPVQRWAQLARRLTAAGRRCVIVGGPSDVPAAAAVRQQSGLGDALEDRSGKTSLRALAALLRSCDLLISADTGPLHIAAAVGTKTVALFGPTNPARTGPYGADHEVIWKPPPCGPCFRRPSCRGRVDCMAAIGVDEVFDAAMSVLREPAPC